MSDKPVKFDAQSAGQEAVAWRDAIEVAVQVLSCIEAGDDVFVVQASEAIAGLTAVLRAPSITPTFEQVRDALCDALDAYPPKRSAAPVKGGEREYVDSTPHLHVGNSAFESWFQAQPFATQIGIKQIARDAYAGGMGDPLVMARADAQQVGGDLHARIMNIRCTEPEEYVEAAVRMAYRVGHRDARHAAAELACAALTPPAKVGGDERAAVDVTDAMLPMKPPLRQRRSGNREPKPAA